MIFTDPQVCVGRAAPRPQARADGFAVRAVEYDMGAVAGAYLQRRRLHGPGEGWWSTRTAGSCSASPSSARASAELLHAATIAVIGEVPLDRLWHAVPSFPTISEIWLRLLEEYGL